MTNIWTRIKEKCRIKNRRDWVIFWVFTILVVYALASRWHFQLDNWMLRFSNPYLTNLNAPSGYGRMMIAAGIIMIIVEITLFLCRKSRKAKIAALAAGVAVILLTFWAYRIHCDLIVSVMTEEPESVYMWTNEGDWQNGTMISEQMTEEEKDELLTLCIGLTPVSKEEALAGEAWYRDYDISARAEDMIVCRYAKRYGHSYQYSICVYDGHIYIRRGYDNRKQILLTFMEDNGLVEFLEEMKDKYR